MGCKECGKPKCNGECGCKSPKVLQINNPAEYIAFHKVSIPAAMGDSTTNPPKIGAYRNALVYYEADRTSWMYSTDGIPTKLTNGLTDYNEAVNLPQINGHTLIGNQSSSDLGLQGELTEGANIQINGNVISATDTTYTAGNGIELDGTEIKAKIGDGLEFDDNGEINIADIEQYAHFFDTVADMKTSENLIAGSYARTLGYHTKNDGGGALYKIRKITNDDVIDESFIIEMGDPSDELIAEYVVSGDIYVEQLGAADLVDSTDKIQDLIDYSIANDLCLKFSNKEYNITSIDFKTAKLIFEKTTFQVIASDEDVAIKVTNPYKGSKYSDFTLKGIGKTGIKVTSAKNITFERVVVEDCKTGFEAYSGYEISLLNSLFVNSSDIVDSVGIIVSTWDSVYSDIVIQGYRTGVKSTVNTTGVYYDKIHIWSTNADTVKNSVGMDMDGGGEVHNCTFDTCLIGVKLHRKEKLYLLNCRWLWNTMWFTDAILDGATPYLVYFDDATCSNWFEMYQCYGYKPNTITTMNFTNISESDWQGLCNIKAHNRDLYIGGFDGYLPLGQKASLNTPNTLTDVHNIVRYNNDSFSLYYVGKIASDAAEGQITLGQINKNIAMTDLPVNTVCTYGNQWDSLADRFAYLYINENGYVQTRITADMRDKYLKIYISYSK